MVYIFREQNCYGFFPFFYKTSLKILEKCTENGLIKKLHPWHWQHSAQLGKIISEIEISFSWIVLLQNFWNSVTMTAWKLKNDLMKIKNASEETIRTNCDSV